MSRKLAAAGEASADIHAEFRSHRLSNRATVRHWLQCPVDTSAHTRRHHSGPGQHRARISRHLDGVLGNTPTRKPDAGWQVVQQLKLLAAALMSANLVYPLQQPASTATDYQALKFFVNAILSHVRTAHPVQVIAVTGGGLGPIGTVDVQPLVSQVNGAGQGDIGLLVCCDRDISNVVATLQVSLPASLRRFNFADGIYLGCSLSQTT